MQIADVGPHLDDDLQRAAPLQSEELRNISAKCASVPHAPICEQRKRVPCVFFCVVVETHETSSLSNYDSSETI